MFNTAGCTFDFTSLALTIAGQVPLKIVLIAAYAIPNPGAMIFS
jgi:hypothetical protein